MQMEVDGRLSKKVISLFIISIYFWFVFENINIILGYGHLGLGFFDISILLILGLVYLCGRYNSKYPVLYFLFCCLYGVFNYIIHIDAFYTESGFAINNPLDILFVLPSSSFAGTVVAFTYNYEANQMIQLSLILQPIAIVTAYCVGRCVRRGSMMKKHA